MTTQAIYQKPLASVSRRQEPSLVERYVLKSFHPRAILINSIGLIWGTYYLWAHEWKWALVWVSLCKVYSMLAVMNASSKDLAQTTIGKIGLLHVHPFNLIAQTLGLVVLLVGVWMHSIETILVGTSIPLLGHLYGWSMVSPLFGARD